MPRFLLASTLLATAVTPAALADVSSWIGPPAGNWSLLGNWSNGVPNDIAIINAARGSYAVTLDINANITHLTIGSGDSLTVPDNRNITLGGLLNDGMWISQSEGNLTDISINAETALFDGTGTIQFSSCRAAICSAPAL